MRMACRYSGEKCGYGKNRKYYRTLAAKISVRNLAKKNCISHFSVYQ
jgi:hypothetical protein